MGSNLSHCAIITEVGPNLKTTKLAEAIGETVTAVSYTHLRAHETG